MNNFQTLPGLVQFVLNKYHNNAALNYTHLGKWEKLSTEEFAETVRRLSIGLYELGVKPGEGFGILASYSPYWIMMDLAVMVTGAIPIPLFANISSENLKYEIDDANIKYIFIADQENWEAVKDHANTFNVIISMGLDAKGNNVINTQQVLEKGDKLSNEKPTLYGELRDGISEENLATIIYTSGSTGVPKGVELSHKNFISQIKAAAERFPLDPTHDTILTCLPLAHVFERMVIYYYISTGCSVYFADDIKRVGEIMREIHPTVITMVPRLLEKVYAKMLDNVQMAKGLKQKIGLKAFERARSLDPDRPGRSLLDKLFHKLVYSKLLAAMGGKLRLVICGSSALNHTIGSFFRNVGLPLYEGYGLTESSPVLTSNYPDNNKLGTVGKSFPGVEIKIAEDGEIWAKGPNIMQGYHNKPDETAAMIDQDGWLHTGDLGKIDEEGYVTITGRKKELFKTSGGKYVSPIPLEQALTTSKLVDMAMVIAENRKCVCCLFFPDFENLDNYREQNGYGNVSNTEFLTSSFVKNELDVLIETVNSTCNEWEKIREYRLVTSSVSIETGELTPTMKLRRHVVEEKYKALIDEMYED